MTLALAAALIVGLTRCGTPPAGTNVSILDGSAADTPHGSGASGVDAGAQGAEAGTLPESSLADAAPADTGSADAAAIDVGGPDSGANSDAGISGDAAVADAGTPGSGALSMNFFVTSRGLGKGGDLRANPTDTDGLAGADAHCKALATAVSPALGAKTWRAYLSTATVNARDRIGTGPWRNQKGVVIAQTLAQLHDEGSLNALSGANSLDETGAIVPGFVRPAGVANEHDILTGSLANGTATPNTCANWTSSAGNVIAQVGHADRMGGGTTSWNAAHTTGGCTETGAQSVRTGGGRGSLYCFALEP